MRHDAEPRPSDAEAASERQRPPALDCARCGSGLTPISLDAFPECAPPAGVAAERRDVSDAPCWLLRCDRCGEQSIWTNG